MATTLQLTGLTEGITCHAWNKDKSMLALCPNSSEIHIYETKNWTRLHTLTEHDLLVASIDWSFVTNKIVSCSHDRNAFVWTYDNETSTWKPALVILRIDRAAIDVKWSMDGLRFAVASGAKCVPVCTYEHANDWWVCKMIKKKFKSTVLCVAFHPHNGQLLATGCADFKCRVFSTFAADVDGTNVNSGPFATPETFGESYCELSALGWVHAVAWSPSGAVLAYAGHDSSVHFATFGGAEPVVRSVRLADLPLSSLLFLSETALVGGGHDFNPTIFTANKSGEWSFFTHVDKEFSKTNTAVASTSGISAARDMFQSKTKLGQNSKQEGDTLRTVHERPITCLQNASPKGANAVSTSGLDGKLIVWNLPQLEINMASLGI